MTDLASNIETAATKPKQASVDGTSVVAQDVDSLIKADKYLAAKHAASAGRIGLRFFKLQPPGGGS